MGAYHTDVAAHDLHAIQLAAQGAILRRDEALRTDGGVHRLLLGACRVQHRRAAQYAMVRRLTAALRIKGRAVQSHQTGAVLSLIASRDDGVKFPQECILII